MDPLVDKHSKIEKLMAKDIDNWLSNLYFQVIKMPRSGGTCTNSSQPREGQLRDIGMQRST